MTFTTYQSAHRPGHNTEVALSTVVDDLLLSLKEGFMSMLTFLLFSAFDTNNHSILVHRLHTDF